MDDEANKRRNFPSKKLSQTFDKYLALIVYRAEPPIMDPPSEVSITGHAIRYRAAGGLGGGLTLGCLGKLETSGETARGCHLFSIASHFCLCVKGGGGSTIET